MNQVRVENNPAGISHLQMPLSDEDLVCVYLALRMQHLVETIHSTRSLLPFQVTQETFKDLLRLSSHVMTDNPKNVTLEMGYKLLAEGSTEHAARLFKAHNLVGNELQDLGNFKTEAQERQRTTRQIGGKKSGASRRENSEIQSALFKLFDRYVKQGKEPRNWPSLAHKAGICSAKHARSIRDKLYKKRT
jgi:hypothetical protein